MSALFSIIGGILGIFTVMLFIFAMTNPETLYPIIFIVVFALAIALLWTGEYLEHIRR